MNSKFKLLFKDTVIFAIGGIGSKLVLFFLVPLYTSYMTKAEYGIADLVSSFSALLVPVCSLSISSSIIRFTMAKGEKKENVLLVSMIVTVFSLLAIVLLSPVLVLYQPISPWINYLRIQMIISTFSGCESAYLKANGKNKEYAVLHILQTIILAGLNILLLRVLNLGIKGYLTSIILASAISAIISCFMINIPKELRQAKLDFDLMKRMLLFSSPLILHNISWWILHSSDKLMIERMVDAEALGLYTAAAKIPSLINVLIGIFIQAWGLSTIREIESKEDTDFISQVFLLYSTLIFGAGILLTTIIKPFMSIYVGEEFKDAWVYTPLLLSSAVFYALSCFYESIFSALHRTKISMWSSLICVFVNVIVNYFFILRVQVWGAIIGTVTSYIVLMAIRMLAIRKCMKFKTHYISFTISAFLVLIQAILVSFEYYSILVSVGAIFLFVLINRSTFRSLGRIANKYFTKVTHLYNK